MHDNHEVGCNVALALLSCGYGIGAASMLLAIGLWQAIRRKVRHG